MNADGSDQRNVTDPHEEDLQFWDYGPSWSPDGTRLVFTGVRMGANGGTYDIITANPDGTRIVYMSTPISGDDWDVWVMNADGTGRENLTQDPAGDDHPTWSDDGTRIYFTSNRATGWETDLWMLEYDSSPAPARRAAGSGPGAFSATGASAATRLLGNVSRPDVAGAAPPPPARRYVEAQVTDAGIRPPAVRVPAGTFVRWTTTGTRPHALRETTLGLFRVDALGRSHPLARPFTRAGTYRVAAPTTTGAAQTVEVPVKAVAGRSAISLSWASVGATRSRVFDVDVRRPGTAGFRRWQSTTAVTGRYGAARPGTYEFRARVRDPATGRSSLWSPVRAVAVR